MLAQSLIKKNKDTAAFLNYQPTGSPRPFPAALCVSINDEVVHGIPNENTRSIKDGDIVSIDCGIIHNGLIVDSAITVVAGDPHKKAKKLIAAAEEALSCGIQVACAGARTGDIGYAINETIKRYGYTTPREYGGHGVGRFVHEDPFVPNVGTRGTGALLREGEVLAIEPMVIDGDNPSVYVDVDDFTVRTKKGALAAHAEHTIIVGKTVSTIIT